LATLHLSIKNFMFLARLILLLLICLRAFAVTPACNQNKRALVVDRKELSDSNFTVDAQHCTLACTAADPCHGRYNVRNGGSLFLDCSGTEACKDLQMTIDWRSMADVSCVGDFACTSASFSTSGTIHLRSAGWNVAYLTTVTLTNRTAFASVYCDDCYGMSLHAPACGRGSATSEIFCTKLDEAGQSPDCGFFGLDGNICCRGVGCTTTRPGSPPLC